MNVISDVLIKKQVTPADLHALLIKYDHRLSMPTLYRILNNTTQPRLDTLFAIASVLDVPIIKLIQFPEIKINKDSKLFDFDAAPKTDAPDYA